MTNLKPVSDGSQYNEAHVALLLDSYQTLIKRPLFEAVSGLPLVQQVFEAEFALVSHNADADPLFNYGNRTALDLFELPWNEFVGMPSRFSAEPVNRAERERLLAEVCSKGFIDNYSGIRIAKSGKRFMIRQAVVWNVYDDRRNYYGQAACFKDWTLLP
ncbi:MAG: MEKHLA domain-containing protein [Methylococcaceae bacterium]|nr:MEKHLA domain-containing protein [Methylococcaceae bacterium]